MTSLIERREMSDEQLEEKVEDAREELFNLRFQRASARLENTARLPIVRHELAQLLELLHKRQLAKNAATKYAPIADFLSGKEWTATAHFSYEDNAWLVNFADKKGINLASAKVNLNKTMPKKQKTSGQANISLVTSYEITR